jgi:zinc transport system permease protein
MLEALQFEFMRNALLAGLLAGVMCGVVGSLVVVNRIVFLAGGIAHAAYGGIGLAFFLGWPFLLGTSSFALAAALVMALVTLRMKQRADTVIGVIWAVGMAIGVILLDLTPGYNVDLMSYLFGSILTVPEKDLWIMLGVGSAILALVGRYFHPLLAMSYDEEFALVRGVPVRGLYLALIAMVAVTVVLVMQMVGLILVIALLTMAPFIAERYAGSLLQMMVLAVLLNLAFIAVGLWLSYAFDLTSGATIILVAGGGFFMSWAVDCGVGRVRRQRIPGGGPGGEASTGGG